MKKQFAILFFTFICVALSTSLKAQSAIAVSPGKAVVSYAAAAGTTIQIRVMENNVNLGFIASPFVILIQASSYTAIGGLVGGRSYRFEVISNGISIGWTNTIVPF
jgi:hypothetical protein